MAVDVTTEIEIERPRAEVAAYSIDPATAGTWYENITSSRLETPLPVVAGSRIAVEARFLGRTLAYTYVVREHVPGERIVMAAEDGPFPMETTYEWADTPSGGTRLTLRNRGRPRGFGRMLGPVMEAAVRRATRRDLARLKAVLEG